MQITEQNKNLKTVYSTVFNLTRSASAMRKEKLIEFHQECRQIYNLWEEVSLEFKEFKEFKIGRRVVDKNYIRLLCDIHNLIFK